MDFEDYKQLNSKQMTLALKGKTKGEKKAIRDMVKLDKTLCMSCWKKTCEDGFIFKKGGKTNVICLSCFKSKISKYFMDFKAFAEFFLCDGPVKVKTVF
jgi:hypothetical protein